MRVWLLWEISGPVQAVHGVTREIYRAPAQPSDRHGWWKCRRLPGAIPAVAGRSPAVSDVSHLQNSRLALSRKRERDLSQALQSRFLVLDFAEYLSDRPCQEAP